MITRPSSCRVGVVTKGIVGLELDQPGHGLVRVGMCWQDALIVAHELIAAATFAAPPAAFQAAQDQAHASGVEYLAHLRASRPS